ncbi:MAG: hypothetical protein A2365_03215 [Candidatus Nealsonbacteria bacterium RIFOXYB1_FULL_40_15]|uniref:DUF1059 domain-containing protein n=2 Tax=Candidatus Nealsoniibacteriota TaxID=1817911 RepID=A0A1G2ETW5_9BACT|nr:MAG: hypothetical protein A2365_03215 [Candidatus Nealsonbacteria bacterium RIFOXYB1_FULL_40_15]OGZ29234.1 MAG: hypothetical protein A2427_03075 [Candidatus Nealsonbacteria bacterium RIFOXYC1_FULL_40_7]OGZ29585.1 MAG: hypothetical protein A2562_03055 [Candidatus Nealsonbacteria bacterium RIFOXYD1_FULL_39_11]
MKKISCKHMGMEDCSWKGEAESEDELVQKLKEHHKEAHPDYWKDVMSKMTDEEIKEMIEPNIKEE